MDGGWPTDNLVEYNKYNKIMTDIQACNSFKYSAYRTAYKLLILQKSLGFQYVSLDLIKGVFDKHQMHSTDNYLLLNKNDTESILYDIFFAASKQTGTDLNITTSLELTMIFLTNLLRNGKNSNSVLFLKTVLVCLSASSLQTKYHYWFSQLANHNLCLPRRRLQSLLEILMIVTSYLSESNNFSEILINPTLDSCFTKNQNVLGISEDDFISWLNKEPQILVWLSIFHRLSMSLNVSHSVQCAVCGMFPIVGLRYHCLQCIHYDLCQLCFYTARSNKHHKPRHVIREYCTESSFYEIASSFIKEVFKRLCGHSGKLQYLPVNCSTRNDALIDKGNLHESSFNDAGRKANDSHQNLETDIRNELQKITCEIEKESRLMLSDVAAGISTNYLIDHQSQFLQERLDKIKALQFALYKKKETNTTKSETLTIVRSPSCRPEKDSTLFVPNSSGFSTWVNCTENEETCSEQLHSELENIMAKLNCMLESNFIINEHESYT